MLKSKTRKYDPHLVWTLEGANGVPIRTKDGAVPRPSKVAAVTQFPHPLTIKSLQGFLGMGNLYHRFILWAAQLIQPLYGVGSQT